MIFKNKKPDFDLIILGSGSGGSVAAHYAQSLGKKVAIFEAGAVGGDCPNFACLPTKATLHASKVFQTVKKAKMFGAQYENLNLNFQAVKQWKNTVVTRAGATQGEESLQQKNITIIKEKAAFVSSKAVVAGGKTYTAKKFLIATGSKSLIPPIPGLAETGYITYKEALNLQAPPRTLLIYGGGAIACEFAQLFSSFGTRVTLLNRSERILSKEDPDVSNTVKELFEKNGVSVLTNTVITKVEKKNGKKTVYIKQGNTESVGDFDEILVAVGKIPQLDFSPEKAGIKIKDNKLRINKLLQTSVPHIYAAGDVIGPYLFTHTSSFQSYVAAQNMFSRDKSIPDYSVVPRCLFLMQEVATVGINEAEAKAKKIKIKKGMAPLTLLARANTTNSFDGFVKIITNKKGVILGGSIIAPRAGEMIHEVALAIKCGLKAEELADMIHAYPTFSEGIKIACSMVE